MSSVVVRSRFFDAGVSARVQANPGCVLAAAVVGTHYHYITSCARKWNRRPTDCDDVLQLVTLCLTVQTLTHQSLHRHAVIDILIHGVLYEYLKLSSGSLDALRADT